MQMIQAVVMLLACHLRSLPGVAWRRIHKNQCLHPPNDASTWSRVASLYLTFSGRESSKRAGHKAGSSCKAFWKSAFASSTRFKDRAARPAR
jgi:hypothetical protein